MGHKEARHRPWHFMARTRAGLSASPAVSSPVVGPQGCISSVLPARCCASSSSSSSATTSSWLLVPSKLKVLVEEVGQAAAAAQAAPNCTSSARAQGDLRSRVPANWYIQGHGPTTSVQPQRLSLGHCPSVATQLPAAAAIGPMILPDDSPGLLPPGHAYGVGPGVGTLVCRVTGLPEGDTECHSSSL
eukprot:3940468-Rhodomonas_salina.4